LAASEYCEMVWLYPAYNSQSFHTPGCRYQCQCWWLYRANFVIGRNRLPVQPVHRIFDIV
jgi:hypothetical protein